MYSVENQKKFIFDGGIQMITEKSIAFIGAGNMAEAIISGIINTNKIPKAQIYVTNRRSKQRLDRLKVNYQIQAMPSDELPFERIDLLLLVVKPKDIEGVLKDITSKIQKSTVVVSVVAGVSTEFIENTLNKSVSVVRVMPNTSCILLESATAISSGKYVTKADLLLVEELFQCLGRVFAIQEVQMDLVTGIAGSGPAYFYYLMEQMEKTCIEEGLPLKQAREISAQTVLGAARMILEYEESPLTLREKMTSPNGTTEAGLKEFIKRGGGKAISYAIRSAQRKSAELTKDLRVQKQ
jgi:pyrroline-5-carboxylate reductase